MTPPSVQHSQVSTWHYAGLAVALAFASLPLYTLVPDEFSRTRELSLTTVGMVLLLLRGVDTISDPAFGWLTDRYPKLSLRCLPWAGAAVCFAIGALFLLPTHNAAHSCVLLACGMAIAITCHSFIQVNYLAAATHATGDHQRQLVIAAQREACTLLGIIVAVSFPSLLTTCCGTQLGHDGVYALWCGGLAILMGLGMWRFLNWSRHQVQHIPPAAPQRFSAIFHQLRQRTPQFLFPGALRLFGIYGLNMLALSIPSVLVMFFVRDRLSAPDMAGPLLLLYFIAAAASLPAWKFAGTRFGALRSWRMSMICGAGVILWAYTLHAGETTAYAGICIFSGACLGADLCLPPTILAQALHTHERTAAAGLYSAAMLAASKLSLALAAATALPLLDYFEFRPGQTNSESSLSALSACYALAPSALKLLGASLVTSESGITHAAKAVKPA